MNAHVSIIEDYPDRFRSGFAKAIALHVLLAATILGFAFFAPHHSDRWGENASSVGAIQASMVSAIPLPTKVAPVKDSVLAEDNVTSAPKPPPKEATQPPPKPTDVLVKAKTPEKPVKTAPIAAEAPPKHPQPTPVTPKAASGSAATQLPEAVMQLKNGTAAITVEDRTFGNRYAYYVQIVQRKVADNWYSQEADPGPSQGKSVSIVFDIGRDGTPSNIRIQTRSGSPTLDNSAVHALQRIDSFGPLPAGDHITVEYTFDYKQP